MRRRKYGERAVQVASSDAAAAVLLLSLLAVSSTSSTSSLLWLYSSVQEVEKRNAGVVHSARRRTAHDDSRPMPALSRPLRHLRTIPATEHHSLASEEQRVRVNCKQHVLSHHRTPQQQSAAHLHQAAARMHTHERVLRIQGCQCSCRPPRRPCPA